MSVHQDDFCAVGDQDAVDGIDRVSRQRHERKITGRLSMDNSKLILPQLSAAHRSVRESNEL